ncbi:MAG: archease [Methanobacteriaceae archaeon]
MSSKYEYFEVTADIGFYAYGITLNRAFENAGLAMFNVITDTDTVESIEKKEIIVESEDYVSLLYDYLEELLFLHETEFLLFSKFNIDVSKISTGFKLIARLFGETIDWNKHKRKSEVKAITFHKMAVNEIKIDEDEDGYEDRNEDGNENKKSNCFKVQCILDL